MTVATNDALVVMEPLVGDTDSQEALSEDVIVAFHVDFLETVMVWFGGFVAPCTA